MLATLTSRAVPVVGFVNEGRICKSLGPEALPTLLNMWLDAGGELGNTFSHVAFLNTGNNRETKIALDSFLGKRGYAAAPVTIRSNEWMFAAIYADAKDHGDLATMKLVTDAYVPYMAKVLGYFEHALSRLFGHEISQVILLHANALNADSLDRLLAMLQSRGYRFVTLAEALTDPAYRTPDDYLGSDGFSCLLRWAQEKMVMASRPAEPAVISDLYAQTLKK